MRWLKRQPKQKAAGRKSAAGKKPARAQTARRWRPGRRSLLAGGGLILLAGLIGLGASGWFGSQLARLGEAGYALTARAGLAVDDVLVEGRRHTGRNQILAALRLERGAPILTFDPHAAKARLEALPWIRRAEVERRLPGLVHVALVEREPIAVWQVKGAERVTKSVIDRDGGVIPGAEAGAFEELLLVLGEDAPAHAAALLGILESEPELSRRVQYAQRVGGRRWTLRMAGGIDVYLPEAESDAAWAQLAKIERQHGLLRRDVAMIDLRLPDRLIVRALPGVTPRRRPQPPGKDT